MPSRDWQNRVRDILTAIAEIREFTNGTTFDEFQSDRKTIGAVLYNLAIIGEAVRGIPPELEALHPEIPWADVRGMRNIVMGNERQNSGCDQYSPATTLKIFPNTVTNL